MATSLRQRNVKYSEGLNSLQIWDVLNYLIAQMSAPYVQHSDHAVEVALSCCSISTNNRRKIGSLSSTEMLEEMFNAVVGYQPTLDHRVALFGRLQANGIERNVFVDHLKFSYAHTTLPPEFCKRKLRDHVRIWGERYETFRRDVIDRYYYLIQSSARTNQYIKSRNGLETTQGDMLNVYMISAMHALDKFIPYKGTLTEYIKTWFQNAEGSSSFVVYDGEAFGLNRSTRKDIQAGSKAINNKAIPIEDRENTLAVDFEAEFPNAFDNYLHTLARFDNAPVLFMAQNLPFVLTVKQLNTIRAHNAKMEKAR